MIEITGDLFNQECNAIVIPTNRQVRKDGTAVMGAGVAKEAAERWPWLPAKYGKELKWSKPYYAYSELGCVIAFKREDDDSKYIITFNTKDHWKDDALPLMIKRGCRSLDRLSFQLFPGPGWPMLDKVRICLPRLGCGLGGLDWDETVKPILEKWLKADRFVVVSPG